MIKNKLNKMNHYRLILASTSSYRAQLLDKLGLAYETCSPNVDETPLENEDAKSLVMRLAESKAKAGYNESNALVIGSDQVCVIDGKIIGKPGNRENAITQLKSQSDKTIHFYTGLALFNTKTKTCQTRLDTFSVTFRALSEEQITRYVDIEQPYFCAGSFKSEGLGIALFSELSGKDPNTLVGLPLIDLVDMLANEGVHPF
jgi:MAF protein